MLSPFQSVAAASVAASLCFPAAVAQSPSYQAGAAHRPGDVVTFTLNASAGQPYGLLFDVVGGPVPFLGETLYVGSLPGGLGGVQILGAGVVPRGGVAVQQQGTPGVLPLGVPYFSQALVLDAGAPNGAFAVSDGESTTFYVAPGVMVEDFLDAAASGYSGEFERAARGRLQAEPVRRRVHTVVPSGGVPFSFPIQNPLNPRGARTQMVYRAADLGALGQREVVTSVRWKPVGPVVFDTFARLAIDVSHSDVVPDYRVDPFTALPIAPGSGLSSQFARNVKGGELPVSLYDGAYAVDPANLQADGYLPYPAPQSEFTYNGVDSLLLDVKVAPGAASGWNGHQIYLMVQSSPRPDARAVAAGSAATALDPFRVNAAQSGDNSLYDLQFEFADVESVAVSPWRASPRTSPDYMMPTVAASVPPGASVVVEYRGASDGVGSNATAWAPSVDVADGMPFLQYRVTLAADLATGAVPSVDAIVVPVR